MNNCWLMQLQILCCGLEDNVHLVSSLGANDSYFVKVHQVSNQGKIVLWAE